MIKGTGKSRAGYGRLFILEYAFSLNDSLIKRVHYPSPRIELLVLSALSLSFYFYYFEFKEPRRILSDRAIVAHVRDAHSKHTG